jgi:hypothetical protein
MSAWFADTVKSWKAVAERLSFVLEEIQRDGWGSTDGLQAIALYSMPAADWEEG